MLDFDQGRGHLLIERMIAAKVTGGTPETPSGFKILRPLFGRGIFPL